MNLDSLCKKLNINNTRQNFHGALLDATLLSKVYLNLTTGKQENLNLLDNKLVIRNKNKVDKNLRVSFSVPREKYMQLSDHEKKQHESFIGEMSDPLWKKLNNYF